MLANGRIRLDPQCADDAPIIYELRSDAERRVRASANPFIPRTLDATRAQLAKAESDEQDRRCDFIARTMDGTALGLATLWGIDQFNRRAHIGISLLPSTHGQGFGKDIVRVLCDFGFRIRNLRRLEIETKGRNIAMRRVAEALGFTHEATLTQRVYDGDSYDDEIVYGLLREQWQPAT